LFALLDISQQQELMQYVLAQKQGGNPDTSLRSISSQVIPTTSIVKLTEIQAENLYFCLENRLVYICETEIMLTVKEFDIFALLIMNPRRVLTYDMIIDLVWHENLDYYSHRAINNHVSNLRHKLKVTPETPDYIRSVHSIGYKFNPNIELL
jgi:DNA-binding response OmpR family regulator